MAQRVDDQEIIDSLASALAEHPSWPEPKRVNVFALSREDAALAVMQAYGEGAVVTTVLFRRDVLAALVSTQGKSGHWVSDADGVEMFIVSASQEDAVRMFKAQAGTEPVACVSADLVAQELARMDQALTGVDSSHLASKSFLAKIAEGEPARG